jgi:hypothetical protein
MSLELTERRERIKRIKRVSFNIFIIAGGLLATILIYSVADSLGLQFDTNIPILRFFVVVTAVIAGFFYLKGDLSDTRRRLDRLENKTLQDFYTSEAR